MLLHERAPEALNPELVIPDLATEFPDSKYWLRNYLLNIGLRSKFDNDLRIVFLSLIRRASHALDHFTSARQRTLRFASWDCSGAIPAGDYFGAIEDWENCVLQFQILIEVMNKSLNKPAFSRMYERGDKSTTERICEMANRVKHSIRGQILVSDLTPLWLEKDGLGALEGYRVTYAELSDELRDACELAGQLVDPATFFEKAKRKGNRTTTDDGATANVSTE